MPVTMKHLWVLAAIAAVAGCTARAEIYPVGPHRGPPFAGPAKIPPGHLPPPGACRIWYPDRPPGHQPPPGPCGRLRHQVPPGAFLVRG